MKPDPLLLHNNQMKDATYPGRRWPCLAVSVAFFLPVSAAHRLGGIYGESWTAWRPGTLFGFYRCKGFYRRPSHLSNFKDPVIKKPGFHGMWQTQVWTLHTGGKPLFRVPGRKYLGLYHWKVKLFYLFHCCIAIFCCRIPTKNLLLVFFYKLWVFKQLSKSFCNLWNQTWRNIFKAYPFHRLSKGPSEFGRRVWDLYPIIYRIPNPLFSGRWSSNLLNMVISFL